MLAAAPLLFVLGIAVAAATAARPLLAAKTDLASARSALASSRDALKERRDADARHELDRARGFIAAARRTTTGKSLHTLRPLPLFGSPTRAIEGATRAADETVAAGRILIDAAASFPGGADSHIDGHDLSQFGTAAAASQAALARAVQHLHAARRALDGPAGAALPPVSGPARAMRRVVDETDKQLEGGARGLDLLAHLAAPGADKSLLLLSQDSMELRPTGGFIGSFGVVHFSHGTVALERYQSYEDLPAPTPDVAAPPDLAVALDKPWQIENVNWWPNFPDTAAAARDMFRRQGGGEVDGVVAVTEGLMARLVGVLGPFQVPGYDKPVVERGFDQRVLYEVELKKPADVPRKKFLTLLSNMVFERLFHPKPGEVPKIVKAIDAGVGAGDIQAWFADPGLQRNLRGTAWSGELPTPHGGDFVMLSEANLSSGKANADLTRQATYQVRRDPTGHLIAHLNVVYRNDGDETQINPYYNAFLRLYVPRGARLLPKQRSVRDEGVAPDANYQVFAQNVYVKPHDQQVIDIAYELPASVAKTSNYHLTWLRQPGTTRDALTAIVGGRHVQTDPQQRRFDLDANVRRHRVREALHGSWVFRKLGF